MRNELDDKEKKLALLCNNIRVLSNNGRFDECKEIIYSSMSEFPDNPEPHNLLGIVLEKTGEHMKAMNHFRAAWALDPTYEPAITNLNTFGNMMSFGVLAYDLSDCENKRSEDVQIKYDEFGIGHVIRRRA